MTGHSQGRGENVGVDAVLHQMRRLAGAMRQQRDQLFIRREQHPRNTIEEQRGGQRPALHGGEQHAAAAGGSQRHHFIDRSAAY